MTKLFQLLALIIFCSSCSTESDLPDKNPYLGKWNLVKMTGNEGTVTTGPDMAWQEYYILNANGTFKKWRLEMNFITELEGTYEIYDTPTAAYPGEEPYTNIQMNYSSRDNIIATCESNQLQENLYFTSTTTMKSTYNSCDGPGLEYEKVK